MLGTVDELIWQVGVEQAVAFFYGETEPVRVWGFAPADGRSAPFGSVRVYQRDGPVPHWHYVGFGLSTPPARPGTDLAGAGRPDLTFRLERDDGGDPRRWPANLLQHVGDYMLDSGRTLGPGHTFDLNAPVVPETRSALRHLLFAPDPDLGGPFLQGVGLTSDELAALDRWSGFADLFAQHEPSLVTRPARTSLLALPGVAQAVDDGAEAAGAGAAKPAIAVTTLEVVASRTAADRLSGRRHVTVTLTTHPVDSLRRALLTRLVHGEPFMVLGPDGELLLVPEAGVGPLWEEPSCWVVGLSPQQATDLADTLAPVPGVYRLPSLPRVTFNVRRSPVTELPAPESDADW